MKPITWMLEAIIVLFILAPISLTVYLLLVALFAADSAYKFLRSKTYKKLHP